MLVLGYARSVAAPAARLLTALLLLLASDAAVANCPKKVGKPLPTIDLFDASLRPVGNVRSEGWAGKPLGSEHPDAPSFIAIAYWGSPADGLPAATYYVRKAAVQPLASAEIRRPLAPTGGTGRDTNGAGTLCQ